MQDDHKKDEGMTIERDGLSGDTSHMIDQAHVSGLPHLSNLHAKVTRANGDIEEYHLGSGLVTNAGVNLEAADWSNATATLKLANYHDSGTGTTAPATTDVAMQTPTGNARVSGTQSNPSAGTYRSVGILSYSVAANITEWGLWTALTGGTLYDHKTFTAIAVGVGDSVTFTYSLALTAGG